MKWAARGLAALISGLAVLFFGSSAWALGPTVDCPPGDYGSFYMARAGTFAGGTLPLPPTPTSGGWRRYVVASASCGAFVSSETTGAHSNGVDTDGPKSGVAAGVLFVAAQTESQLWEPAAFTGFTSDVPPPAPSPSPSPEPSPTSAPEPTATAAPSATPTVGVDPMDPAGTVRLEDGQFTWLLVFAGSSLTLSVASMVATYGKPVNL